MAIGGGCKKLRVVTLSDSYYVSDRSLAAIASGCPNLAVLEINGCHNIGTAGVQAVGRSCRLVMHVHTTMLNTWSSHRSLSYLSLMFST